MKKVKFRINVPFKNYKAGDVVTVDCDEDGMPLQQSWYRRYLDSPVDNCISPVAQDVAAKTKKEDK
jgi:hypothetical protein